jgi:hypothetical protein
MDQQLIQRTRYLIRSRSRRVQTCPAALFPSACEHFLFWLMNHPVLSSITRRLEEVGGEFSEAVSRIIEEVPKAERAYTPKPYAAKSSLEHSALCLRLVKAIAASLPLEPAKRDFYIRTLGEFLTGNESIKFEEALEVLRDVAVDNLYEYLDEQLDARNALYAILLKYKQRSEWYHRHRLRIAAAEGLEGKVGEGALATDLQEYVLDQGVEFTVEPTSASGEVDLLLRDSEGRYIIIEAKYVPEDQPRSKVVAKIASGFHQVARYCDDYNEPEGFLVVFTSLTTSIRLELSEADGLRYLSLRGKNVYYVPVDVAALPSASKAGKADEFVIPASELVAIREDSN